MLVMTNGGSLIVGNTLGSSGTLEISGGTNLFNSMTFGLLGTALVKITGGYTWTTNRLVVGSNWGSTGRVELTGGVLAVSTIDGRSPATTPNPGGISKILFDGGTLQHSWYLSDFKDDMVAGFGEASLTDRGAVIDTAGSIRRISQALSNEVGYAGSIVKKGAGKLTLASSDNAFTGRVAVQEGELAVSGGVYLTGGVAIDAGAVLNLASGTVRDALTVSGTVSRIDGTLILKSGTVLTNGVGAALGGTGVVTGSVVFATGSVYARNKADGAGVLRVTGNTVIRNGVTVALTGYTLDDLAAGIPLVQAVSTGTLQVSEKLPVTLDGASHPYWWTVVSADGKTLAARVISLGTLIKVL
jgi:autotransporter-associated beta strand protein